MKKIISTVGTSLFTNESEFKEDVKPDYENLLEKSNLEWNNYEKKIDKIKENIKNKLDEDSSAEIKSIVKIIEKLGKDEEYELYFLCSDTCASRMAAEILTDYFNKTTNVNTKANFHPGDDVISKLQIENVEDFKEGMTNLIDRIYQIAGGYFENIVLNITGGYKATIPFMTLYAQVNKIPLYYIFESSSELIEIPYFPVDLDLDIVINEWIAFDLIGKEVKTDNPRPIPIEEFKNSLCNEDSYEDLMMKGLIYEDAGNIRLTPTGRILYGGFKRAQEDEKFNEGNIVGKLIELKIYEYWNNKVRDMSGIVENGKKFGDNGYEADIFVKYNDNEKVICIEC
ncbi:MAG: putative CRISPR-associated protein, partial [bacterium]